MMTGILLTATDPLLALVNVSAGISTLLFTSGSFDLVGRLGERDQPARRETLGSVTGRSQQVCR